MCARVGNDAMVQADRLNDQTQETQLMGANEKSSLEKNWNHRACMGEMEKTLSNKLSLKSGTQRLERVINNLQQEAHL